MNIELRVWWYSSIHLCRVAKNSIVKQLGSVAVGVPVAKTLPKVESQGHLTNSIVLE